MSTNRSGRIDRETAEQLLGGAAVGSDGGHGALSQLLAAAAAPATERELAGEQAAVAAFREATRLAPTRASVPAQRSRPMAECLPARPRTGARFLGARAAVAALAVTALGGVAVAAGTGHLPAVLGGDSPNLSSQNTAASSTAGSAPGSGRADSSTVPRPGGPAVDRPQPGGSASSGKPGGPGDPSAQFSGPAAAALLALCKAWPQDDQQGDADSRFEPLTRAAGGSNRVRAYCAELSKRWPDPDGPGASATAVASQPGDDRQGPPGHSGDGTGGANGTGGSAGSGTGSGGGAHGGAGVPTPAPTGGPGPTDGGSDHSHPAQGQSQPAGGHVKQ